MSLKIKEKSVSVVFMSEQRKNVDDVTCVSR